MPFILTSEHCNCKSMSCLLGPTLCQNCMINPTTKLHIFKTYAYPILRSGLSTFPLRPNHMKSLEIFFNKTLKSTLKLSITAKTSALLFLSGEIPIAAQLHLDIFSLFYNVWSNPQTKIFKVVKYLLETSNDNSHTWCIHLRHLSRMYSMTDPLTLLYNKPPSKDKYKQYVKVLIVSYHEKEQRQNCVNSESMKYFNVNLRGLGGYPHPAIQQIYTTNEVYNMRAHIKLLTGNYLTNAVRARQSGGSAICSICSKNQPETYSHLITQCESLSDPRERMLNKLFETCRNNGYSFVDKLKGHSESLTQFILDPASLNLSGRINFNHEIQETTNYMYHFTVFQLRLARL